MRLAIILLFFIIVFPAHGENSSVPADTATLPEQDEGSLPRPLILRFGKYQQSFEWESAHAPPSCTGMSPHASELCFLVREASARAATISLSFFKTKKGEFRRQFALVAYDPANHAWHDIILDMRVDVRHGSDVRVESEGYQVTVLRGLTLNQMVYEVWHGKEQLFVYAAKHLSIPVGTTRAWLLALKFDAEPVVYMATPEYLNLPEFKERGKEYALEHIREALDTLHELRVESKAFPGKLITDVVSDKLLLTVLAIEQSDPFRMFGEHNERLIKGETSEEVLSGVFVRFMVNGLRAYHYICSNKSACGGYQFTNGGKLGTYDIVRAAYPGADLDPNFIRGSLSFVNGAKAAALLIDLELANGKLPEFVRTLYMKDQRFGGLFPIAAYNGGASQSLALAGLYTKLKAKLGRDPTLDTIPWDWDPLMRSYKSGKPLKRETAVYLRKYQLASGLIF